MRYMLNLKVKTTLFILAFSLNVFASIDISDLNSTPFTIATESFDEDDFTDGLLLVVSTDVNFFFSDDFNISTEVGFSVGVGESRFVRFDLIGAKFGFLNPVLDLGSGSSGFNGTISDGGVDETFIIFEITDSSSPIQRDDVLNLSVLYNVKSDQDVVASYRLYETSAGAVNEIPELLLASESATLFQFSSGFQSDFSQSNNVVATVSSNFTEFDSSSTKTNSSTIGQLGSFNVNDLVVPGVVNTRSWPIDIDLFIDTSLNAAQVTIEGHFSVGTFSVSESECGITPVVNPAAVFANSDNTELTVTPVDITKELFFCLDVTDVTDNEQQILPSEYTILISPLVEGIDINDNIGEVSYNTTAIEVPYITTFSDYRQRILIVNKSDTDAVYSVDFIAERGIRYTEGQAANGIAVANQVTLILTDDLVELTNGNRVAAIIEIELDDASVAAATQIVNSLSGEVETLILH